MTQKRLLVILHDAMRADIIRKKVAGLLEATFVTGIIVENGEISFIDDAGKRIKPALPSFDGILLRSQLGDEWRAGMSARHFVEAAVLFGNVSSDVKFFFWVGNEFDQDFMHLQEGLRLVEDVDYFDSGKQGTLRLLGALTIWSEPHQPHEGN